MKDCRSDGESGLAEKEYRVNDSLVSIIIPVYNVAPYLQEALDSVVHQTYSNMEIIIIDDGSMDSSGAISDEYAEKDPRIHVIHQENKGLSNARNAGLDQAAGEYIAFLDPDDAFDTTFIEELKTAIDCEPADLAIGKYTIHYTTGKMHRKVNDHAEPRIQAGTYDRLGMLQALADGAVNVSVWNKLYRRELWEKIRFPEGHVFEDQETAYRIMDECGRTVIVDNPLYFHRKRRGSITRTVSRKIVSDRILAASRVDEYAFEKLAGELSEDSVSKIRQNCLHSMMIAYCRLFRVREDFDKNAEGEKLRQQILRTGERIDMENCRTRTRVAFRLIRSHPRLFRIVYSVYRPPRALIYRLTGK